VGLGELLERGKPLDVVLEAAFDYGDGAPRQAVLVFELRGGRVARETAYWTQPFAAAEWRAQWVERSER